MPTYSPIKPGSQPWNNLGLRVFLLIVDMTCLGLSFANHYFIPFDVLGAFFATSIVFTSAVCILEHTRLGRKAGSGLHRDLPSPSLFIVLMDALGCIAFLTIYIICVCGLAGWRGGYGWGYYPTLTGSHAAGGGFIACLVHGHFALVGGYHYFDKMDALFGRKGQRCPYCNHCNHGVAANRVSASVNEYDENADAEADDSPRTEVPQMSMKVATDKKGKRIAADDLILVANETGNQEGDRLINPDNVV